MPEDALVNTSAVEWPHADSAYFTVRGMQIKLHQWAGEDPSRRFGDLFNLVYDPAFLMHAWERVSTNIGARTPGIDKATVAMIETWVGVEEFLGQIRDSLKAGEFRPVEVRQVMIPKGTSGKLRKLGIPTDDSYCPSCNRVSGCFWIGPDLYWSGPRSLGWWCEHGRWHRHSRLLQRRRRGLVRRAAGLRCPDWPMRLRHSARIWSFQGMCSRFPAPRRAVSCPVSIQ